MPPPAPILPPQIPTGTPNHRRFPPRKILQGYQGLVDGGDNIKEATWESVSMMLQLVSREGGDTGGGGDTVLPPP